jgi:hypothetical protein
MHNPWKVVTLGLIALGATVGTSTLTTAYLMRPPVPAPEAAPAPLVETARDPQPAVVRVAPQRKALPAPPRVVPAVAVPRQPAGREIAPATAVAREIAPGPAPMAEPHVAPAVQTVATNPAVQTAPAATTPADCDTGGDRALRIAKPGALGALLGAGLGAAGGAIANGGKGAGKGALVGGLAGAALGTGYGAYKTKNECGTILGDGAKTPSRSPAPSGSVVPRAATHEEAMAPLQSPRPGAGRIQIYDAR